MKHFEIREIKQLSFIELQPLVLESLSEGFEFVERLAIEYKSGANRFQQAGEVLFGAYQNENIIGICGLNKDPYLPQENDVARVRHLYVLPDHRKKGVGRLLVQNIIVRAKTHFSLLTLRTFNPDADRFYRAIGFITEPKIEFATHYLKLSKLNNPNRKTQ